MMGNVVVGWELSILLIGRECGNFGYYRDKVWYIWKLLIVVKCWIWFRKCVLYDLSD